MCSYFPLFFAVKRSPSFQVDVILCVVPFDLVILAPTFQVGPHHCCIGWRIIYEDFGVIYFLEDPSPSCIKWCENLWRPSGLFIELPSIPSWGRLVGSSLIFPVDVPFLRVFGLLFGVVFFAFDVAFLPGQYFLHWICVHFGEGIIELTHP